LAAATSPANLELRRYRYHRSLVANEKLMAVKHRQACLLHRAAAPMGRREFLRAGPLGFFGLGLPGLLRARDQAPAAGRAKACILLFLWGGLVLLSR
jgi:hypothetical protein